MGFPSISIPANLHLKQDVAVGSFELTVRYCCEVLKGLLSFSQHQFEEYQRRNIHAQLGSCVHPLDQIHWGEGSVRF